MRVEDLYGEESPEPTKRTDTPKPKTKTKQEFDLENLKKEIIKLAILNIFVKFFVSLITYPKEVKKVY